MTVKGMHARTVLYEVRLAHGNDLHAGNIK